MQGIKSQTQSQQRQAVASSTPSNGNAAVNATSSTDSPVNMGFTEPSKREKRTDQLIDMAGDDSFRTNIEAPRLGKMKG